MLYVIDFGVDFGVGMGLVCHAGVVSDTVADVFYCGCALLCVLQTRGVRVGYGVSVRCIGDRGLIAIARPIGRPDVLGDGSFWRTSFIPGVLTTRE